MPKMSATKKMKTGFFIFIVALACLSVAIFFTTSIDAQFDAQLDFQYQRLLTLRNLLGNLDAASAAQSTFMLVGDERALFARSRALRSAQSQLDELESRMDARDAQLNASITDMMRLLDTELTMYTKSNVQAIATSGLPLQLLNARQHIHELVAPLIADEQASIKFVHRQATTNTIRLNTLLASTVVVVLCLLLWFALLMRSQLRERGIAENKLRDANAYFESLLENIPAMIFIKDAEHLRFVRINKAGENLLGITREELIGKSDHDFFPTDQAEFFIRKDREVLAQDRILEIPEETINTRHHGQRWLHTLKVPVMNAQKQAVLLMGISMDVTAQKQAEQRIKALNAELEEKAKLLKISNNELETFCYSVSHDLRAPLRTIEGFAQLLEENQHSSLDADALRYLNTIRRSSKQMSQLIDDLLAYSKVGRQSISPQKLDMELLATRAMEVASFGRNPKPEIIIDPLPEIFGDETMLSSVWLNLIDNAIKYSAKHVAPRIRISAKSDAQYVTYSVQDNGVGFDMQQYEKLFDVFQRLHSDHEFSGTGLGLAIVERIVSRHGGGVWAEGQPQQGAVFYFSLPIQPEYAFC